MRGEQAWLGAWCVAAGSAWARDGQVLEGNERILWDGRSELKEAVMLKASALPPERQGHPRDCWSRQRLHQH